MKTRSKTKTKLRFVISTRNCIGVKRKKSKFSSAVILNYAHLISDDRNVRAEREGYTEDPLTSNEAMSENTTSDFIPMNPSGVLDVNGTSITAEDISNQMLHKLQIDLTNQSRDMSASNPVSSLFIFYILYLFEI